MNAARNDSFTADHRTLFTLVFLIKSLLKWTRKVTTIARRKFNLYRLILYCVNSFVFHEIFISTWNSFKMHESNLKIALVKKVPFRKRPSW